MYLSLDYIKHTHPQPHTYAHIHAHTHEWGLSWQVMSVDLVGSFTPTKAGIVTILVLGDHFARWRAVISLPSGNAEVVGEALEHQVFCYVEVSERIHTDKGSQLNQLCSNSCVKFGEWRRAGQCPTTSGYWCGRGNRVLGDVLRAMLLGGDYEWVLKLPHIMRYILAMPHNSMGETSNFLMMAGHWGYRTNLSVVTWTLTTSPGKDKCCNNQRPWKLPMTSWSPRNSQSGHETSRN